MRIHAILMSSLVLALVFTTPASAAPRGDGPRGGHGGPMMHALQQLELDPAQRDAIHARMQQLRADGEPLRDESRALRESMHALVTAEDWDAAAASSLAARHGELAAERALLTAEAMHEVYAVLDDTQRAELESIREARQARREQRRHARRDD